MNAGVAQGRFNVLVLGKGGREHALARHLAASPLLGQLWVCPGNPGMELDGLACIADDGIPAVVRFCHENHVQIVIPGPEAYMVTGLKAALRESGVYCFSPTPELARLESSKRFAKDVLHRAGVATAAAQMIADMPAGEQEIARHDFSSGGLVLKADGLAQGKGVVVCANRRSAERALAELGARYGFPLLFEEQLAGPELSAFALCHGKTFRLLGTACDYKRISSDPYSANTGGMGAYSPCDFLSDADASQIEAIFSCTLQALAAAGLFYEGFLFAGLMKTATGLSVLEFNVRLGDPETQALLPRLEEDLLASIARARDGALQGGVARRRADASVHVVAASRGYPQESLLLGRAITLPPELGPITFAGVERAGSGLVNSGGRVLGATALAPTRMLARERAYAALAGVAFEGMVFRPDIGA